MALSVNHEFSDVSGILAPSSVAVIGASDRHGNLGGDTLRCLIKFGFPGPVWPVNPKGSAVDGRECFSRVSALPNIPDLAILAVPADALIDAIDECARFGIKNGIAYAGGFAEAGDQGVELQQALTAACLKNGFNLCGPNCVGVINASLPATSTFSTALFEMETLRVGNISILGQSGGICTTAMSMIQHAGFGIRQMVSSGNEAVISFADYLYAFARDPETTVIAGYLEGVQDGPKFLHALEEARLHNKAVVLIKAGATRVSARAAMAHTGALVGQDHVFNAIFNEMGVIRVSSMEELVDVTLTLVGTHHKQSARTGVGIVTFGGGNGVLATDQCADYGLETPQLSDTCIDNLYPLLVSVATAANPLDLTPTTAFRIDSLAKLHEALNVVADEKGIHSLLLIAGSLASRATEISNVMLKFSESTTKPVIICWPSPPSGVLEHFASRDIFTFLEPERAVRVLSRLRSRTASLMRPPRPIESKIASFDWALFVRDEDSQSVVPEHLCHQILDAAGLPVAAGKLVNNDTEAIQAADSMGLPVALKGIHPKVTHRAKAGLVALDLQKAEDVMAHTMPFTSMRARFQSNLKGYMFRRCIPMASSCWSLHSEIHSSVRW